MKPLHTPTQIFRALTQSLSLRKTLEKAFSIFSMFLPIKGIFVNFFSTRKHEIKFLAWVNESGARQNSMEVSIPENLKRFRNARHDRKIIVCNDIQDDPFTFYVTQKLDPQIQSYIMMRLYLDNKPYGIIAFYGYQKNIFSDTHKKILRPYINIFSLLVGFTMTERLWLRYQKLSETHTALKKEIQQQKEGFWLNLLDRTPTLRFIEPLIESASRHNEAVLISGESGVGKERIAKSIVYRSERSQKPMIRINCATLSSETAEDELFGHEKGALQDNKQHTGFLEEADSGTIILDEIDALSPDLQGKLLRVIQDKVLRRIGGHIPIPVDIRIIATTNTSLRQLVQEKKFRLDLFYRLNIFPIHVPALRNRKDDIVPLMQYFIHENVEKYHLPYTPNLTPKAIEEAYQWHWPGNVRELKNVCLRASLAGNPIIDKLPLTPRILVTPQRKENTQIKYPNFEDMQKEYFQKILEHCHNKISGPNSVARITGIHPNTLRSRLQKLGLL